MIVMPDRSRTRVIAAEDVARWIEPGLARNAARRAASYQLEPTTTIGRVTLGFPGGWMRLLGAAVPLLGVVGYKEFHLTSEGVRYAIHLFDIDDGRPLGIVDGALLTPMRTAAAAAAAAVAYVGNATTPVRVGIIGSGAEAEAGLRALAASLPVKSAVVTSRREANCVSYAERMAGALGVEVTAVAGVDAVSRQSDVVYVATASGGQTVVAADQLGDLALLLSIGSTLPSQRELEAGVLTSASLVIVDTMDVLEESGDALAAVEKGLDRARVCTLGEFLAAPRRPEGRTVYKSIGSPEQDVVLAAAVLAEAEQRGFGQELLSFTSLKKNLP